jgi:hypothetical protein
VLTQTAGATQEGDAAVDRQEHQPYTQDLSTDLTVHVHKGKHRRARKAPASAEERRKRDSDGLGAMERAASAKSRRDLATSCHGSHFSPSQAAG